jgi:hypothetical protein
MKSKIFVIFIMQFSIKLYEVILKYFAIQEFVLASYFTGSLLTFMKQYGTSCFPITRGGSLSPSSALQRGVQ